MLAEGVEEVLNHLIFHQAMYDEENERIGEYIKMVEEMKTGVHVLSKDPVDRAIAIVFELVLDNHMDPWKIDLKKFAKLYMERIKDDEIIDFVTAGKIIFMAWSILHIKSEQAVERIKVREEENEFYYEPYDAIDWLFGEEPSANFSEDIIPPENIPEIQPPVRRREKRKVTLIELIKALESTRRFVELKKRRRQINNMIEINLSERVHEDEEERDINLVWERICELEKEEFYMNEIIVDRTREEYLTVFLSLLFLMKRKKVILEQSYPYGPIKVKLLVPTELKHIALLTPPAVELVSVEE